MKKGTCIHCEKKDQNIAMLEWDGHDYKGCCESCARKFLDDQFVGMVTRIEYPKIYFGKLRQIHKGKIIGVFQDANGYMEIRADTQYDRFIKKDPCKDCEYWIEGLNYKGEVQKHCSKFPCPFIEIDTIQ